MSKITALKLMEELKEGNLTSAAITMNSVSVNDLKDNYTHLIILDLLKLKQFDAYILFMSNKDFGKEFITFLHLRHACFYGLVNVVEFLHKSDLLLFDSKNEKHIFTSFKYACRDKHLSVAKYFIENNIIEKEGLEFILNYLVLDDYENFSVEKLKDNPVCQYLYSFKDIRAKFNEKYPEISKDVMSIEITRKIVEF
jgi:hypothetical protein